MQEIERFKFFKDKYRYLMAFIKYQKIKKNRKRRFAPEKRTDKEDTIYSPSGKYKLIIRYYSTTGSGWNYSKGFVFRVSKDKSLPDTFIANIERNYCSFLFHFIEDHPNGNDYMICGEDYQSQTILELNTGRIKNYIDYPKVLKGTCYCWIEVLPSESKTLLAINGCYWAFPSHIEIYDFSNPMKSLERITEKGKAELIPNEKMDEYGYSEPIKKYLGDYHLDSDNIIWCGELMEWEGDEICKIGFEVELYKENGMPLELMPDDEVKAIEEKCLKEGFSKYTEDVVFHTWNWRKN